MISSVSVCLLFSSVKVLHTVIWANVTIFFLLMKIILRAYKSILLCNFFTLRSLLGPFWIIITHIIRCIRPHKKKNGSCSLLVSRDTLCTRNFKLNKCQHLTSIMWAPVYLLICMLYTRCSQIFHLLFYRFFDSSIIPSPDEAVSITRPRIRFPLSQINLVFSLCLSHIEFNAQNWTNSHIR